MGAAEEPPLLRRSLRILAKQKFKEEKQQVNSTLQQPLASEKPGNSSPPTPSEKEGEKESKGREGAILKKGKRGIGGIGVKEVGSRKRKRSPVSSPPRPKKQAKNSSPSSKNKGKKSNHQYSLVDSSGASSHKQQEPLGNSEGGSKRSKRKQNSTNKGYRSRSVENRETVIVQPTSPQKRRSQKNHPKHAPTEHSDTDTDFDLGGKVSGKGKAKSRNKSKAKEGHVVIPKGKGRSGWNSANSCSLPSLVDFARLNMATPG